LVPGIPFDEWELEVEQLIDHGDQVIVQLCQRGQGAGSGAAVEIHFGQVHTFRNGQPLRITNYMTYDEALKAAGLSE
jgi:ketosteroid isomerase-like protein